MTTLTDRLLLIKINNPPPAGSKAAAAWINTDEGSDITSKYTLKCYLPNEETGIPEQWTYNINADVSLKRFKSTGAPEERELTAEYSSTDQFLGYDRFNGSIGFSLLSTSEIYYLFVLPFSSLVGTFSGNLCRPKAQSHPAWAY
jgi:hypothetical protein